MLFHADSGVEKALNPTGLWVWKRLDGSRSVSLLAEKMTAAYEGLTREQAERDVKAFVEGLVAGKFAVKAEEAVEAFDQPAEFPDAGDAPQCLDLSITGRCNLHCPYCFYASEMEKRGDLPLADWIRFFGEMGSLAVRSVTLSGGEVFARPDVWDWIDALIEEPVRYSVLTNGTLITEREVLELEREKRRIRLDSIQVSIDGSRAEVHDRIRGRGSFDRAVRGLRLLVEAGFPVTVRVTVNPVNVEDLEPLARFLLEDVGLPSFGTNDVMAMGAGCENQGTVTLTPRQQLLAMQALSRLAEAYDGRITAMAGPLARLRQFRAMEAAKAEGRGAASDRMGCLSACGGVFSKLSVHHDGVITPCNILPSMVLGRMNEDPLSRLWKEHPSLAALRERKGVLIERLPGCEGCAWAPYCIGSCPGVPYESLGDIHGVNPEDCLRRFLLAVGAESLDEALGRQGA